MDLPIKSRQRLVEARIGNSQRSAGAQRCQRQCRNDRERRGKKRAEVEVSRRSCVLGSEEVFETAPGFDRAGLKLLARARHHRLERIRVAPIVATVEVLEQLRPRHDTPLVMHEVGDKSILERFVKES